MKKKIMNIIVSLVVLILVLIVGYLLYDKYVQNKKIGIKVETNVPNKYGVAKPDASILVYSYVDQEKKFEFFNENGLNEINYQLRIPQLNFTTKVVEGINSKILNDFSDVAVEFDNAKSSVGYKSSESDYDFFNPLKDNIVYIFASKILVNETGSTTTTYYSYIYDVKNDKELTVKEILIQKGITEEKIIDAIKQNEHFIESYENKTDEDQKKIMDEIAKAVENFSKVNIEGAQTGSIQLLININNFENVCVDFEVK
ncbi:MAG: hypothetical protein RSB67_01120 [Clostridia bacterium]